MMRLVANGTCFITLLALLLPNPAAAHHSYADFDRSQPYEVRGTLVSVDWRNPHILLTVDVAGAAMRVEWITLTGAEHTGATKELFAVGEEIVVSGNRHRDPQMRLVSLVRSIQMPAKDWLWTSPELTNTPLITPR